MRYKLVIISLTLIFLISLSQATIGQDGSLPPIKDLPVDVTKLPVDVQLGFSQGNHPVLVIHCFFGARPGDPSFGFTDDNQWNSILLTTNTPKSSMRDYYREVSYWPSATGLDLTPAAETSYNDNSGIVHVRIDTVHPYHKGGTFWDTIPAYQILGINPPAGYRLGHFVSYLALMFADIRGGINYAAFDSNNDGSITPNELHIIVVIAGFEAAYGGAAPAPRTWAHRWAIPGNGISLDGKFIGGANYGGGYSMVGELTPTSTIIGMGLVCHEIGHDLGLPDLYDTNGGSEGLGRWCLMSSGNWLGTPSGTKPVHPCVWAKVDKGWITPTNVTSNNFYDVKKVETNSQCYKIQATTDEYFLVENRRQVLFDTLLPGQGFLIYHISDSLITNRRTNNMINATVPYGVALEQADGFLHLQNGTNRGDAGDPFPGSSNNTAFDSIGTNPDSRSIAGVNTGCGVNQIPASADSMRPFMYVSPDSGSVSGWQPMAPISSLPSGKKPKSGSCMAGLEATGLIYFLKASNRPDFYSYTPDAGLGTWTILDTIPKGEKGTDYSDGKYPKRGAAMAAYEPGKRVYVVRGNNRLGFWEYQCDTLGDTIPGWYKLATIPLGAKRCKYGTGLVHVTKAGKDYLLLMKGAKTSEFYLYDIETNTWTAVSSPPVGTSGKTGYKKGSCLCFDGSEYVFVLQGYYGSFFYYKVEADSWFELKQYDYKTYTNRDGKKKKPKDGASLVYHDNNVYMLKGGNTNEVWKYDITLDDWFQMSELWDIPLGTSNKKVKDGGAMIKFGDYFYASKGKNTDEFYHNNLPTLSITYDNNSDNTDIMAEISKTKFINNLMISPNPATNFTKIRYRLSDIEPVSIKLYNVVGEMVKSITTMIPTNKGELTLQVNELLPGVYILQLETNKYQTSQKLIIQK